MSHAYKNRGRRIPASLLCVLLACVLLLTACNGTGSGTDTEASGTTAATEPETQPAENPQDTPKTGEYKTSSDLVLPAYTYDSGKGDNNVTGILPASRDVFTDLWVATDGLGRSTPAPADTRVPTAGQVGIFYFLWRDADQDKLSSIPASNHHEAWLKGGDDLLWEVMQEGGEGHPHYWAEPYFGYYSSNDEWVLRKHAYMFAEAGIDFVFFDTTNNNLHTRSHMTLLKVWEEVKQEGYNVPKVCFLCGDYDGEFHELYNSLYKKGLYQDLWFYWNGKPLVMTSGTSIKWTDEEKDFFEWRLSWATASQPWYQSRRGRECWPWSDDYSPSWGMDKDGNKEQLVVMCGGGGQVGRSYARGGYPKVSGRWDFGYVLWPDYTSQGLMFSRFFDFVVTKQPSIVMITGWNEWIAGRWSAAGAGAGGGGLTWANEYQASNDPTKKENSYFVDEFNPEFSRDIEPMKGGFGDAYFYQMAEYVRLYKGSRYEETAFGQWAIDLDGSLGQWYAVGPEYRDYQGDITERVSPGHVGGAEEGMYINFSGRNDFVTAKVSTDSQYLYFMAECASDITAPEGNNWMNLFINADCDDATGWYGYDYLLNRGQDGSRISVEKFVGTDTWELTYVGEAEMRVTGNTIQIKVKKSLVDFGGTMQFKWADNSLPTHDVMEFLDQGDCAPNGRFNYLFTTEEQPVKLPECLTSDMIVLKSGSYNAFVNGESVRLVSDNTKAAALCSDHELYLPAAFLASAGISVDGAETIDHYGVAYVHANDLIAAAGKTVTVDNSGLVIIASGAVEDGDVITTLYRALK